MHRESLVLEAEAQVGKWLDFRARITSKEFAPLHCVQSGILQNASSTSHKMDADLGKSALMCIARLLNSLAKGPKKWWQKCSGYAENYTTIGEVAYFKIWSRSLHRLCGRAQTYGSQSDVFDSLKPCYVMLTFETRIHRLEWFAQVIISVTPMLQNFEDRSQEETEWQERCAREAAWKLAKSIQKLMEKNKTAFFSPSENWCLPAPSSLTPEESEFVVDSRASMYMISKKSLNSAELETMTKSCSLTIVITANGEVQTHEDATVYVKELDVFLTESPRKHASIIVARKALRWKQIFLWMDQWSKTTSH